MRGARALDYPDSERRVIYTKTSYIEDGAAGVD
jgi:hypothetical protein